MMANLRLSRTVRGKVRKQRTAEGGQLTHQIPGFRLRLPIPSDPLADPAQGGEAT